tara:strand:- start:447 stop:617 length:171 start_codon:yes stop_codon:yes gene_type:complete
MELSKEQLDAIEAVKGKRDPKKWDLRCKRYLAANKKTSTINTKPSVENTVKVEKTS